MRWTWAVALTMGLSLAAHDASAATSQRKTKGAAVGAVIGLAAGDGIEGAIKGAVVGGAAGAMIRQLTGAGGTGMENARMLGLTLAAVAALGFASPAVAAPGAPAAKKTYEFEDVAHLSCAGAWAEADKSVDNALSMIETLLGYLLESRGQTFPDTKEAGATFGAALDKSCKADPQQLFLAAVDSSLREVVKK